MRALAAARFVAVVAALLGSVACGAKTPTEPSTPAPVYELKTETFTGAVRTGASTAFPFTVVNPGDIQVSITALGPISSLTMGIALGFWDATAVTCTEELRTTTATLNVAYTASPSAPGEYCVGIFDTGNVQVSSDFLICYGATVNGMSRLIV